MDESTPSPRGDGDQEEQENLEDSLQLMIQQAIEGDQKAMNDYKQVVEILFSTPAGFNQDQPPPSFSPSYPVLYQSDRLIADRKEEKEEEVEEEDVQEDVQEDVEEEDVQEEDVQEEVEENVNNDDVDTDIKQDFDLPQGLNERAERVLQSEPICVTFGSNMVSFSLPSTRTSMCPNRMPQFGNLREHFSFLNQLRQIYGENTN